MPTKDFIDIGDVLNHEYLRGEIITLDESDDTCTVRVGSTVYSALIFYHCEPDSELRSNGAIKDGATGFVVGDQVIVMMKNGASPEIKPEVKVIGHVNGARHCRLGGTEGYYIFYLDGKMQKVANALFGRAVRVNATKTANEISHIGYNEQDTPWEVWEQPTVPVVYHIKKIRHNVMTNGTRVERDLYYIFTSIYFNLAPFPGWTTFATNNPGHPIVANNLNTEITMTDQVMADLQTVNYDVNHEHSYISDPVGNDNWKILGPGESGDCEDFALTKAQTLLDLGYPASALHIETGFPPIGGTRAHAWLVVQTTQGNYALDIGSDSVILNASVTLNGEELILRRRQIGSNWAYISAFSPFLGTYNMPTLKDVNITYRHRKVRSYIYDPLLNVIYRLPHHPVNDDVHTDHHVLRYRDAVPFRFSAGFPLRLHQWLDESGWYPHWYDETNWASPSINFSEDNDFIYYHYYGIVYKYRLDENILTEVSRKGLPRRTDGFVDRNGTVIPSVYMGSPYINPTAAEVASCDGYYDFNYVYYYYSLPWPF